MNSSCRCASASASLACSLALSRSRTGTNASKWASLDFLFLVKIRPGWWQAVTNSELHHFAENPWPDHLQPIPVQHAAPPASARVSICVKTAQNAWETPYKCTAKYCKCGRPRPEIVCKIDDVHGIWRATMHLIDFGTLHPSNHSPQVAQIAFSMDDQWRAKNWAVQDPLQHLLEGWT